MWHITQLHIYLWSEKCCQFQTWMDVFHAWIRVIFIARLLSTAVWNIWKQNNRISSTQQDPSWEDIVCLAVQDILWLLQNPKVRYWRIQYCQWSLSWFRWIISSQLLKCILILSSRLHLNITSGLPTKIPQTFLSSAIHTTFSAITSLRNKM
jgi:hypothetical protein